MAGRSLQILNGGNVSSSTVTSSGDAGKVEVRADQIYIDGKDSRFLPTGIFSYVDSGSTGEAGTVRVSANKVDVFHHGSISTSNLGIGDAGNVWVKADTLNLSGSSFISTTTNTGDGGAIRVQGDILNLHDSGIETTAHSPGGNGGDIDVQVDTLLLNTGLIQANAVSGHGGAIRLDVKTLMASGNTLNGKELGSGNPFAVGRNEPRWQPHQFGNNIIQAVSQTGVNGTISLSAPQLNLSGVLANLGAPDFDTGAISRDYCAIGGTSSLVVEGQGALPRRSRDLPLYGF